MTATRIEIHVDALGHDVDAGQRVRVVAGRRGELVVEKVPYGGEPAEVYARRRARGWRRGGDATAINLLIPHCDPMRLDLFPLYRRGKVALRGHERRGEEGPNLRYPAEPDRARHQVR